MKPVHVACPCTLSLSSVISIGTAVTMLVSMSPLTFGFEALLDTESVPSSGCSEINDVDKVQSRLKGVSLSYDTDSSKKQSLSTTGPATATDSCNKMCYCVAVSFSSHARWISCRSSKHPLQPLHTSATRRLRIGYVRHNLRSCGLTP